MTKYYKVFPTERFKFLKLKPGAFLKSSFGNTPVYSCDSPNWLAHWHAAFAYTRMYPATDVIFTEIEPIGNIITQNYGDGLETTSDALRIIRTIPKSQMAQMQLIELQSGNYDQDTVYFNYLRALNMELAGGRICKPMVVIDNVEYIADNSFYNTRIDGNLSFANSKITRITPGMFRKIYIKGNLILPDNASIMHSAMKHAKITGQIYSATEAKRNKIL